MWKALKWWWLVYINYHISEFWASECRESVCSCLECSSKARWYASSKSVFCKLPRMVMKMRPCSSGQKAWGGGYVSWKPRLFQQEKQVTVGFAGSKKLGMQGRGGDSPGARCVRNSFLSRVFSWRQGIDVKGCTDAGAKVVSKRGCLAC